MRDTEREKEAETQAEGEAGSMQGARCGTRSQDSRITPWAEGRAEPLSHLGCPKFLIFNLLFSDSHSQDPTKILLCWSPLAPNIQTLPLFLILRTAQLIHIDIFRLSLDTNDLSCKSLGTIFSSPVS